MIKQYKKKNGEKAWYFKTYLGIDPLTGKKKYTTKRGFRTQKEAKTALSRLELELQKTLLAFSGCRIGEILALTWDNINFKTNEMAIKKTVARSDKYYISETPKTKKSNRIIYLDEKTIKQLKFWKLEQRKYLFQLGFAKANYLFTNDENNFTINQSWQKDTIYIVSVPAYLISVCMVLDIHMHQCYMRQAQITKKSKKEWATQI